jgi:hypothetical protein
MVSQIILYQGDCGIVLVTDSRAVHFTASGEPGYFNVSKLYPLAPGVLLATVGAGFGHSLCQALQQRIRQLRLVRGEDMVDVAYPFLRDAVLTHQAAWRVGEADPELQRVYFILAGTIMGSPDRPMGFVVYASEHPLPTGHFVCIPRQLSLEQRLLQLRPEEVSCRQVEELCANFLVRLASLSEDVGAPFVVSHISAGGVRTRTLDAPATDSA